MPVEGHLLGADGRAGVEGYYIPRPALVEVAPYLNAFLQAYAASRLTNSVTSTSIAGSLVNQTQTDPGVIAIQEAAKMATDYAKKQEQELMERHKPYYIVVAGTTAYVQLLSPFVPIAESHASATPSTAQLAAEAARQTIAEINR